MKFNFFYNTKSYFLSRSKFLLYVEKIFKCKDIFSIAIRIIYVFFSLKETDDQNKIGKRLEKKI